jgi:hypothetical protein
MKKRSLIILLSILLLIIILITGYGIWVHYVVTRPAGPGTAYEVNIVQGCDIIHNATSGNFEQLSDEDKENITVEYGYGAYGLNQTSLKEFCSPENKNKDRYEICSPGFMSYLFSSCIEQK